MLLTSAHPGTPPSRSETPRLIALVPPHIGCTRDSEEHSQGARLGGSTPFEPSLAPAEGEAVARRPGDALSAGFRPPFPACGPVSAVSAAASEATRRAPQDGRGQKSAPPSLSPLLRPLPVVSSLLSRVTSTDSEYSLSASYPLPQPHSLPPPSSGSRWRWVHYFLPLLPLGGHLPPPPTPDPVKLTWCKVR